eukprot:SAG31_NODE_11426_length_1032_cov_0.833869_1_plen_76_part_00
MFHEEQGRLLLVLSCPFSCFSLVCLCVLFLIVVRRSALWDTAAAAAATTTTTTGAAPGIFWLIAAALSRLIGGPG